MDVGVVATQTVDLSLTDAFAKAVPTTPQAAKSALGGPLAAVIAMKTLMSGNAYSDSEPESIGVPHQLRQTKTNSIDSGIDSSNSNFPTELYSSEEWWNDGSLSFPSMNGSVPSPNSDKHPFWSKWDTSPYADISADQIMMDDFDSEWTVDLNQCVPSAPKSRTGSETAAILQLRSSSSGDTSSRRSQEQQVLSKTTCSTPTTLKTDASRSDNSSIKYPVVFRIVHGEAVVSTLVRLEQNTVSSIETQAQKYLVGKLFPNMEVEIGWYSKLVSVTMNSTKIDVSCYQDDDLPFLLEHLSMNAIAQCTVSVSSLSEEKVTEKGSFE